MALEIDDINMSGTLSATSISATTLSGATIFSGSTNVSNLFATSALVNLHTSQLVTKANLSGASFTDGVTSLTFSATTVSGGTIFSGSTNVSSLFTFTKLDFQSSSTANTVTATSTLVDVGNMILTARTLGSSATTYQIYFNANFSNNTAASTSVFRILNNSTEIVNANRQILTAGGAFANARRVVDSMCFITGVTSGNVIKVQMSATTGILSVSGRTLSIIGVLNSNIV